MIDLGAIPAKYQATTQIQVTNNEYHFFFFDARFDMCQLYVDNMQNDLCSFNGFLQPDDNVSFSDFIRQVSGVHAQPNGTYFLLRFIKCDFGWYKQPPPKENPPEFNKELIVIDPDYLDFPALFQFSCVNPKREMTVYYNFHYSITVVPPVYPRVLKVKYPYTFPLLNRMAPTDIEEFYCNICTNKIIIPSYGLYRSSPQAVGFDIVFDEMFDNSLSRQFTCVSDLKDAAVESVVLKPKYLLDILIPNFYNAGWENNGKLNNVFLRSSVSKKNISMTLTTSDEPVNSVHGRHLCIQLQNHNNYSIKIGGLKDHKDDPKRCSLRLLQWVPSQEIQHHLFNDGVTGEKRMEMLGVNLAETEKPRKEKI
jgi:hypothetical protein